MSETIGLGSSVIIGGERGVVTSRVFTAGHPGQIGVQVYTDGSFRYAKPEDVTTEAIAYPEPPAWLAGWGTWIWRHLLDDGLQPFHSEEEA